MRKQFFVMVALAASMAGCGESASSTNTECPPGQVRCGGQCIDEIAPNLTAIQEQIFDQSCTTFTACHLGAEPAQGLDLSSVAASAEDLIGIESEQVDGKLRVAPNDSDASYIVNKITGIGLAPNTLRMPISARFEILCEPQIDAIREWIDLGAPIE
jgi:hypothetical protein